jgi:hypothetical protein
MIFSMVLSTRAKATEREPQLCRARTPPKRHRRAAPSVCAVFLELHVHYDGIIELPDGPRRAVRFNFESE